MATTRRLLTILSVIGLDIAAAAQAAQLVDNAGNPLGGNTVTDWPSSEELYEIKSKSASPIVAVIAVPPSRPSGRYITKSRTYANPPVVPLVATVTGSTVTFSGTIIAGLNVHALVGRPLADVYHQTDSTDVAGNLDAFATRIAGFITAANVPNVSVVVSGAGFTVTGGVLKVNVGGSTTGYRETSRVNQRVQVSGWALTAEERADIGDVIVNAIGTPDAAKMLLPDGTKATITLNSGPLYVDDTIQDAMLKRVDLTFQVDYANVREVTLTQVGSFTITRTLEPGGDVAVSVEG